MIITSKEEAMSLALLEALNCGLYTITTPVSGSKEMIEAKINGDFINIKDYLSLEYSLNILSNLEDFPINIEPEFEDYYNLLFYSQSN